MSSRCVSIFSAATLLLASAQAFATSYSIRILDGNRQVMLSKVVDIAPEGMSVSDLTLQTLKTAGMPFRGDAHRILAIGNLPTRRSIDPMGGAEGFGWCYTVNDQMPSYAADEVRLRDGDNVVWYYGRTELTPDGWSSCH